MVKHPEIISQSQTMYTFGFLRSKLSPAAVVNTLAINPTTAGKDKNAASAPCVKFMNESNSCTNAVLDALP